MSVFFLLEYFVKQKTCPYFLNCDIHCPYFPVSFPRPYLPDSTLYAFPHDCGGYGPLPAFIQLPKARDDNTLK